MFVVFLTVSKAKEHPETVLNLSSLLSWWHIYRKIWTLPLEFSLSLPLSLSLFRPKNLSQILKTECNGTPKLFSVKENYENSLKEKPLHSSIDLSRSACVSLRQVDLWEKLSVGYGQKWAEIAPLCSIARRIASNCWCAKQVRYHENITNLFQCSDAAICCDAASTCSHLVMACGDS